MTIPRAMIATVAALLGVMGTALGLALAGFWWSGLFSQLATAAVMFTALGWVVIVDSRSRWPGAPWWARLARVLTFYR